MWKLKWVPQTLKVTCRARVCPAHIRPPPHHHLKWWFVATTVVQDPWFWFPSTPLLPGLTHWPFVWSLSHWTPLDLSLEVCPINCIRTPIIKCLSWLFGLLRLICCLISAYYCLLSLLKLIFTIVDPTLSHLTTFDQTVNQSQLFKTRGCLQLINKLIFKVFSQKSFIFSSKIVL